MTEMVHPPHLADQHAAALAEYRPGSVTMSVHTDYDGPDGAQRQSLRVDGHDVVIICSGELIEMMRDALAVGPHVRGDILRIIAANADLTYGLRPLGCGCYLGELVV